MGESRRRREDPVGGLLAAATGAVCLVVFAASGAAYPYELEGHPMPEGLGVLAALREVSFLLGFAAAFMAASQLPRPAAGEPSGPWGPIRLACRRLRWNEEVWVWLFRLAVLCVLIAASVSVWAMFALEPS